MATFGKILAVLNIFLAIGLLVILGKDYGRQQAWTRAELLHRHNIIGLPIDDKEIDEREPGDTKMVERLTPGVLKEMFQGNNGGAELGGPEVKTVMEEV